MRFFNECDADGYSSADLVGKREIYHLVDSPFAYYDDPDDEVIKYFLRVTIFV
jgi:hypothetical protein